MTAIDAGKLGQSTPAVAASWFRAPVFWFVSSVALGSFAVVNVGGVLSLRLIDVLWFAAACIALAKLTLGRTAPVLALPGPQHIAYWLYFGLLIAYPMAGIVVNGLPAADLSISIRYFVLGTLIYVLHAAFRDAAWSPGAFTAALRVAVVANLVYALLQYAEFAGIIPFGSLPHHYLVGFLEESKFEALWRPSGLFTVMNILGWFGCTAGIVFLAMALTGGRFLDWLFSALALSLPMLANSRTALLCALAAFLLMGLVAATAGRRVAVLRWFGMSSLLVALIVPAVLFVSSFRRVQLGFAVLTGGVERDTSLTARIAERWPRGIEVFLEYPWGYGGAVGVPAGTAIDSAWISYLAQGSFLLPLAFLAFLLTNASAGLRTYLRRNDPFGLALLGASAAIAIGSTMLPPFNGFPVVAVTYLLLLALTLRPHAGSAA